MPRAEPADRTSFLWTNLDPYLTLLIFEERSASLR
jgi:hypothetical protein